MKNKYIWVKINKTTNRIEKVYLKEPNHYTTRLRWNGQDLWSIITMQAPRDNSKRKNKSKTAFDTREYFNSIPIV